MAKKKAKQQPEKPQFNEFEQLIEDVVARRECEAVSIIKAIQLMTDEIKVLQNVCEKIHEIAESASDIAQLVEDLQVEMSVVQDALGADTRTVTRKVKTKV